MKAMKDEVRWPIFAQNFSALLERTGVTTYRLDEDTPLRSSNLSKVKAGTRRATDDILRALADYEPLGISYVELASWRLQDEYPPEVVHHMMEELEKKRAQG